MDNTWSEINPNDSVVIPNWFNLDIYEIYYNFNPATKKEQKDQ
jgi:hypothetical protein